MIWTALPNGIGGTGEQRFLRLSVFVSPRLDQAANKNTNLQQWPDLLNWPEQVRNARFKVEFEGGPTVEARLSPQQSFEPDLWRSLFKNDTFVQQHSFDDFSGRPIISYPVRNLYHTIKQLFQDVGNEAPTGMPQRPPISWQLNRAEIPPVKDTGDLLESIEGVASDERYIYATHYFGIEHESPDLGELIVFDKETLDLVKRIPVGRQPRSVAINPQTDRIYVVNYHQDHYSLSVIDRKTLEPIHVNGQKHPFEIFLGQTPWRVAVSQKYNRVYVTNLAQARIHVIDGATNTLPPALQITQMPEAAAIAVDDERDRLYVVVKNGTQQDVVEIELSTAGHTTLKRTTINANVSRASEMTLDADHVYVNNVTLIPNTSQVLFQLVVLDRELRVLTTIPTGPNVADIAAWPDRGLVYATTSLGYQAINIASRRIIGTIPLDRQPNSTLPVNPLGLFVDSLTDQVIIGGGLTNQIVVATPAFSPEELTLEPLYTDWNVPWNEATEAEARQNLERSDLTGRELAQRLQLFHRRKPEPRITLPSNAEEFRQYVDFHQVHATLGDYPALMRAFGFVVDLEIPLATVPPSATAVRIVPTWQPTTGVTNKDVTPKTACIWDGNRFVAKPFSAAIVDGMLVLDEEQFDLIPVDLDGAALKTTNLSANLVNLSTSDPQRPRSLPALRSAGMTLTHHDRARSLRDLFARAKTNNATVPNNTTVLFAEDLVRGYRLDIWDDQSTTWRSLFKRAGTYTFETANQTRQFEDEGWAQTAVTEGVPTNGTPTDLYLHEAVARWEGWSLAARRPGKSINHSADPSQPPEAFDNSPVTPFKLRVDFAPVRGSLPRLRFGWKYRVRARIADLAGNGPTLEQAPDVGLPQQTSGLPYLRYQPVPTPAVVLRALITQATTPGEALERIVLRTANNDPAKDNQPGTGLAERHIAPPRASQLDAETHGVIDRNGKLRADTEIYTLMRTKDDGQFATQPAENGKEPMPVEPSAQLNLPYLPDPLSRGAALRDLPGAPTAAVGTMTNGTLSYTPLSDINLHNESATQISWGDPAAWPELRPFRLVLRDGAGQPLWDNTARTLTLQLPKASSATVPLSSFMNQADLALMGVWQWLREHADQRLQKLFQQVASSDPAQLEKLVAKIARNVQYALEGGHMMLTPPRYLTLVHAVQQPLGHPVIHQLAVQRKTNASTGRLSGELGIHAASTDKVTLVAAWNESVDRPAENAPHVDANETAVIEIPINILGQPLDVNKNYITIETEGQPIARYFPDKDRLQLIGSVPRHAFGDTKHRNVHYRLVSTSRFREYFSPDVPGGFTRSSAEFVINVPSTAKPRVPRIQYVVPAFGWERQTSTNLLASRRRGHTLRVYLDRPWFSSGEGELLGVVVWPEPLNNATRERLKPYITQVGADPILLSDEVRLDKASFPTAVAWEEQLKLDGLAEGRVNVAAFKPDYDAVRKLWFCDITLDPAPALSREAYGAFVRLALVRYQPNALAGQELSRAVLADFAQLTPDRAAIASYDPYEPQAIQLTVSGLSYNATAASNGTTQIDGTSIEVAVEQRRADIPGELGWELAPAHIAQIVAEQTNSVETALWRGRITLPAERQPGQFRIVIKEFEHWFDDITASNVSKPRTRRLVYSDTLEV
jgi:DNA-binding beta-propeller fold protein YncE